MNCLLSIPQSGHSTNSVLLGNTYHLAVKINVCCVLAAGKNSDISMTSTNSGCTGE